MKPHALISVSDKTGIADFAATLIHHGYQIISTGGTYQTIKEAGHAVTKVSDLTGFPEILGGRVKSLHPKIHGGILARRTEDHLNVLSEHDIPRIDMVVVNLYPFESTISKLDVTYQAAVENIDIGGPAMLRAAAKNHESVAVVTDPEDYHRISEALNDEGEISLDLRRELAVKGFQHTAGYDARIATWLSEQNGAAFPDLHLTPFVLKQSLRYGENPHQPASFYVDPGDQSRSIATSKQLWGKELSYNNLIDLDAILDLVRDWTDETPFCAIVKHTNPCGAAIGQTPIEAYQRAVETDPVSYFGGIVGFNVPVDEEAADEMAKSFLECIIAPSFSDRALVILKGKKNIRLMTYDPSLPVQKHGHTTRRISGGLLVQAFDDLPFDINSCELVAGSEPEPRLAKAMTFAWKIVKQVKSNAIVLATDGQLIGVGAGQMSRVDATRFAIMKARDAGFDTSGSVLASDAFFPFRDSIDKAAEIGVRAIIQPGGSIRDEEVIAAANEHNITMIFTRTRHFKH